MFCKNCGTQIKENERFCGKCGTPVEQTNQIISEKFGYDKAVQLKNRKIGIAAVAIPRAYTAINRN